MVKELLKTVEGRLASHKKGGIALTVLVTGLQNPVFRMLNDEARENLKHHMEERTAQDMAKVKKHIWDYTAT